MGGEGSPGVGGLHVLASHEDSAAVMHPLRPSNPYPLPLSRRPFGLRGSGLPFRLEGLRAALRPGLAPGLLQPYPSFLTLTLGIPLLQECPQPLLNVGHTKGRLPIACLPLSAPLYPRAQGLRLLDSLWSPLGFQKPNQHLEIFPRVELGPGVGSDTFPQGLLGLNDPTFAEMPKPLSPKVVGRGHPQRRMHVAVHRQGRIQLAQALKQVGVEEVQQVDMSVAGRLPCAWLCP